MSGSYSKKEHSWSEMYPFLFGIGRSPSPGASKLPHIPVTAGTREKRSAHACLPCFRRIFAIEIIRDNKTN